MNLTFEFCHKSDSTETEVGTDTDENQENINLVFHMESVPLINKIFITRHCQSIFKKTNNNNN